MKRLTPEQQELAARPEHIAMAKCIAAKFSRRYPNEAEAVEAAALFGLVDAASVYDPVRGVEFVAFAQYRIRGEIGDALRELMPKGYRRQGWFKARGEELIKIRSLSQVLCYGDRGPVRLGETVGNGEEPTGADADYADFVTGITSGLTRDMREAVRLYYLRGLNLKQIGLRLGKSETRISQLMTAAMPLLRERVLARLGETTRRPPGPVTQAVLNRRQRNRRAAAKAKAAGVAR